MHLLAKGCIIITSSFLKGKGNAIMPIQLMIVYRILGLVFLVLAGYTLWEKYRTVRGAVLLPGRVLECRKASRTNPHAGAGGYRYLVEVYANGQRMEMETNDAFWFDHAQAKGKVIQVWYNPASPVVERKSIGTELLALGIALVGVVLLLIR